MHLTDFFNVIIAHRMWFSVFFWKPVFTCCLCVYMCVRVLYHVPRSSKQTGALQQKVFHPSCSSREKPRVATLLHLQHTQNVASHYEVVIEKDKEDQIVSDDSHSNSSYNGRGRGGVAVCRQEIAIAGRHAR